MKKSEQYRLAQLAVLHSNFLSSTKLEIIKTLQSDEDMEKLVEKRKEEEAAKAAQAEQEEAK